MLVKGAQKFSMRERRYRTAVVLVKIVLPNSGQASPSDISILVGEINILNINWTGLQHSFLMSTEVLEKQSTFLRQTRNICYICVQQYDANVSLNIPMAPFTNMD